MKGLERPQRRTSERARNAEKESTSESTPESPEYRERREESYRQAQALIDRISHYEAKDLPEATKMSHVERLGAEEALKLGEELNTFLGQHFPASENMDPMQHQINNLNHFGDTYLSRGADGKIVSALQTVTVDFPNAKNEPKGIGLGTWYVATDKEYTGKPVTPTLFRMALEGALAQARVNNTVFESVFGETEHEVEKLFNRFGLSRLYYYRPDGATVEVPYEAPPEDESDEGSPAHLMVKFFDGTGKIELLRLATMVGRVHQEYSREEYFSRDYLKYAQGWYNKFLPEDEQDDERITTRVARAYHDEYLDKVRRIGEKFHTTMSGVPEAFPLSERQREALRAERKTVVDWNQKEEE